MGCTYKYNGKTYDSYQELIDSITAKDVSTIADILFSQEAKQDVIYDKIQNLNSEREFSTENTEIIDGSPDIAHNPRTSFTTQTFIDSAYFNINGESPMFRLSNTDYVNTMKRQFVDGKTMTPEEAESWGSLITERWEDIATDAKDFHRLMMAPPSDSISTWNTRVQDSRAFKSRAPEIAKAEREIAYQVLKNNGKDKRGGDNRNPKVIKNINLSADLRNMTEKILGHIDYMVIDSNGDLQIYNIKTSTEPYSAWAAAKKEKYRYQMALLKRMLAFHGIDSRAVHLNIIPVQMEYETADFDTVKSIRVGNAVELDTKDLQYTFKKYDNVANQFIDSKADFTAIKNDSILKVDEQLKHIFPEKDISATGIKESAKEWVREYWKYCSPEVLPEGGYKLVIPTTKEVVTVSDPRKAEANEEFVNIVQQKIKDSNEAFSGDQSAYYLRTSLQQAFAKGWFDSSIKGEKYLYMKTQFQKYLDDYKIVKNDKGEEVREYTWELVKSPVLDAANIVGLRHRVTGQLDVFTLSGCNPTLKHQFKGRSNLLGYYLTDSNDKNFTLKATYGNMEAIRTLAVLNEALPQIGGDIKLGQLKIVGLGGFSAQKGVFYEFDSIMTEWDTVVKVVNANSPANIENKFRSHKIECIAPEEVLHQTWLDIISDKTSDQSELEALGDIINQKTKVDGTVIEGLMGMSSIEGKITKLQQLLDRLKELSSTRGIPIHDSAKLLNVANGADKHAAAIAKIYIVASQALSRYYGDVSLNNEEFGTLEEYAMKPTSIGNSNVRQVANMVQKSIDTIHSTIKNKVEKLTPIFKEFYEKVGYSTMQNALVGNQASVYSNMFQRSETGENLMLFKNPYDPKSDLQPHERTFLKKILYEFYKVHQDMLGAPYNITGPYDKELETNMPSTYLYVPLQKASNATRRANLGQNLSNIGNKIKRIFTNPTAAFEETLGNLDEQDVENREAAMSALRVYNPYSRSYLSLQERNLYMSTREPGFFETNIENIFIDFISKQEHCAEFDKLLTRIKGIELVLTMRGAAEGNEKGVEKAIKAIEDYTNINIHNSTLLEGGTQKIEAFVAPLRRLVSKMFIAMNPVGAVRDTTQGLLANLTSAIIKYQTDVSASDVMFAYKEVVQDGCTSIGTMSKLNQFNIKYGFSNFDMANVGSQLKSNRGGVLNADHWAYWTLRAPDYLNRMTLFVAKLKHDGAYDAYSLDKEGRLKYDWRKDKRFSVYASGDTSNSKYQEQQSLYFSTIRAFNIESGTDLAYTDDLPDAYTPSQIRSIKTLGESLYGAYDKSSKSKHEFIFLGMNFLPFSTWMNGIVDNYFKRRQVSQSELKLEQETDYNGNPLYFVLDSSGKPTGMTTTENTGCPVKKYVPIMVQGIIQTFEESYKELVNNNWSLDAVRKNVWTNETNRRNLRRLNRDLLMMMLYALLFKLWLTPAYKEHKKQDDGRKLVQNIMLEIMYKGASTSSDIFMAPGAVLSYLGNSTNPSSYSISAKIIKDAYHYITGKRDLGETIMGSQALVRSMQDSYKMYLRDTQ